ncbi:nSTAND1 domain-containing NTPase [Nonomuraea sp. NPDC004186]
MSTAQLREVIEKPAERVELTLEGGLAERIVWRTWELPSTGGTVLPALSSDPSGVLPLLSHTLRATWGRREGRKLTLAGYQATGGVSTSLARTADTALEKVGLANRDRARRLLTRLVHLGEGSEPSRRKVPLAELLGPEDGAGHGVARQVLDRFVEHRLVTVNWTGDGVCADSAGSTAEFTHEALIRAWKQLRDWIEEDRDALLVREQLDRDARAWAGKGRDAAYLYRGLRLASAQDASGDDGDRLGNDARDFLDASIRQDLAEREAARRRARNRTVLSAVLAVLLITVTGTAMTVIAQMRVSAERAAEGRSRALASLTEEMAKNDPGLAALAAVAAYKTAPTQEARSALLRRYDQFKDAAWVLSGVQGPIEDVAMSSDGSVTLATSKFGRATLFARQAGGKVLRQHLNLLGNAFSPLVSRDGRRIAYVLEDLSGSLSVFWHEVHPTAHDIILGPAHLLHGGELTQVTFAAEWGNDRMAAAPVEPP